MQKLTLDQAAEELGIKRESVYKRARRGTLDSSKGSDGRMYVYLDDPADRTKSSDRRGLYRFLVEVVVPVSSIIAGFVAGLVALLYALGLLALWIPISNVYTGDLTTAWYAASLVPRTVVVGLGMGQLLGWPALISLMWLGEMLIFVLPFYAYWRLKAFKARPHAAEGGDRKKVWAARLRRSIWLFVPIVIIGEFIWLSEGRLTEAMRAFLFFAVLMAVLYCSLWLVIRSTPLTVSTSLAASMPSWSRFRNHLGDFFLGGFLDVAFFNRFFSNPSPGKKLRPLPDWRRKFVLATTLLFLGGMVLQVNVISAKDSTPLPSVQITGASTIEGELLSHAEGNWYILNGQGQIVTVPDSKVKTVHTFVEKKANDRRSEN